MKLQALTGAFGAEVEGLNLGQGVNARDMQLIAAALAEKSVLVFRDQDLDDLMEELNSTIQGVSDSLLVFYQDLEQLENEF